jgi:hypothetical protein
MNLTAHPYAVAAEMAWKNESLSGANRHPEPAPRRKAPRRGSGSGLRWPRRPRHTIRPA